MRKKTLLLMGFILILGLVIAGCGSGSNDGAGSSEEPQQNDTEKDDGIVIGFSDISVSNSWRTHMHYELEAEAKRQNVTLYSTNAGGDTTKQISDVQDLVSRGIDALLIAPGSTTALNAAMKKTKDSGIPVVAFSSDVEDEDSYTAFVGSDNVEYGYLIAEWLLEEIGGEGDIVVLAGLAGNSITVDRLAGLEKAISELPDGGEKINILAEHYTDWAQDIGKQAMEQSLAANPEIDGVWAEGGAPAQGAIEAIQASGRDLIPVTGEDNNGYLKLWKELEPEGFKGIAAGLPPWLSAEALHTALDILDGKEVEKKRYVPIPLITEDTLDDYVRTDLSDSYWANSRLEEETLLELYSE